MREGEECVARVCGELDVTTEGEFRRLFQVLLDELNGDIELDLSELAFLDVHGLRAIEWASAALSGQGRALRIVGVPQVAQQIFALVGRTRI
jgi:anti-anti-sigma factor